MTTDTDSRSGGQPKSPWDWHLSTTQDLETALDAAERLLRRAEEQRRHAENRTFGLLSGLAATALSLFASILLVVEFSAFSQASARFFVGALSITVSLAIIGGMGWGLYSQLKDDSPAYTRELATELAAQVEAAMLDVA